MEQVRPHTRELLIRSKEELHPTAVLTRKQDEKPSSAPKILISSRQREEIQANLGSSIDAARTQPEQLPKICLNIFPNLPSLPTQTPTFKLIDEKMMLNTQKLQKRLTDNPAFVIGVIGKDGSGKTTISKALASQSYTHFSQCSKTSSSGIGMNLTTLIYQRC